LSRFTLSKASFNNLESGFHWLLVGSSNPPAKGYRLVLPDSGLVLNAWMLSKVIEVEGSCDPEKWPVKICPAAYFTIYKILVTL
jgi:hypothetical protein